MTLRHLDDKRMASNVTSLQVNNSTRIHWL